MWGCMQLCLVQSVSARLTGGLCALQHSTMPARPADACGVPFRQGSAAPSLPSGCRQLRQLQSPFESEEWLVQVLSSTAPCRCAGRPSPKGVVVAKPTTTALEHCSACVRGTGACAWTTAFIGGINKHHQQAAGGWFPVTCLPAQGL